MKHTITFMLAFLLASPLGCAALQALQPRATCLAELARPETALKIDAGAAAQKRVIEDARAGVPIDDRDLVAMREAGRVLEAASRCLR